MTSSDQPPAFALCIEPCNPSNGECTSPAYMDHMIGERYHQPLSGTGDIATAVLQGWDMWTHASLSPGGKQMFMYIPPCLVAIETALSISMGRANDVNTIFSEEQRRGEPYNALPCKIRIDERLATHGCGASNLPKMQALAEYLNRCATDQQHIPQMEMADLSSIHSGPWTARHFDLPYLNQRCHASSTAGAPQEFSMEIIKSVTPNSNSYKTGNLVIASRGDLGSFEAQLSPPNEPKVMSDAGKGTLFTLSPDPNDAKYLKAAQYGRYGLDRPFEDRRTRRERDRDEIIARQNNTLENQIKNEGKKMASWAFGKAKKMYNDQKAKK